MAKKTTPSFITEIPLKVTGSQERELLARFQAGRQLYNACLSEALVRMELVRNSEPYQQAKKLNKEKDKAQRKKLFKEARELKRFTDYDLQSYANHTARDSTWIANKIDSNTQQAIGKRAFKAVDRILFGKAKKVRFKPTSQFTSLEGKTNKQGIRWFESLSKSPIKWSRSKYQSKIKCSQHGLMWGDLFIKPIIDWFNPVTAHGLNSRIKYCRVLWRTLNGKRRWYVQLVNEGLPYQKPQNYVKNGVVGIDINLHNVAFVADEKAGLFPFADKVPSYEKEIKQISRKMASSLRIHNPENYEPDSIKRIGKKNVRKKGNNKKGRLKWKNTKTYRKLRAKKAELQRRKASYAKSQNRKVVNKILRHGNVIKTENVSMKGWQRMFGKQIAAKSPGSFQSELSRKAESAGGKFIKFSTRKTALSQTHLNGKRIKKKLSQRVHHDEMLGKSFQRDIWSAFLARYVNDDLLSLRDAQREYPGMESYLMDAWKIYQQQTNQVSESESRKRHSSSESVSAKGKVYLLKNIASFDIYTKGKPHSEQIANTGDNLE